MSLFRRKSLDRVTEHEEGRRLVPTLGWPHLVALCIGAIVGTGIYTLTGVGADRAGPAVILAFAICGVVCACAALAYTELATMIPTAGSAYTYTYTVIGETVAWVVGWSLILEYSLACSTVAVGWSGYFTGLMQDLGVHIPAYSQGTWTTHSARRRRKLLLNRSEIDKIERKITDKGYTIVPLSLYFKDGRAKVEIALGKGKKLHDKRQTLRERQDRREAERAMSAHLKRHG